MKRSELTETGETYRITPAKWGKEYIMVDEDDAAKLAQKAFELDEPPDPDDDPNDTPETVHIAVDKTGKHYAILEPFEEKSWGHKTGKVHNQNMYRPCQDPAQAVEGCTEIYGNHWETFDDEDEQE